MTHPADPSPTTMTPLCPPIDRPYCLRLAERDFSVFLAASECVCGPLPAVTAPVDTPPSRGAVSSGACSAFVQSSVPAPNLSLRSCLLRPLFAPFFVALFYALRGYFPVTRDSDMFSSPKYIVKILKAYKSIFHKEAPAGF